MVEVLFQFFCQLQENIKNFIIVIDNLHLIVMFPKKNIKNLIKGILC